MVLLDLPISSDLFVFFCEFFIQRPRVPQHLNESFNLAVTKLLPL